MLRGALGIAFLALAGAVQLPGSPAPVLPAAAVKQLTRSLEASRAQAAHLWRDTPPFNADGSVNGYIEIARGDRRKWEFDMRRNERAIDRVIPGHVGAYPVNYGFVPQTVSYDGDPFDVLVLGPPVSGGTVVRGIIVGLMYMIDGKDVDSKVVLSPAGADGRPAYELTASDRQRIADFFNRYKPGDVSNVPGWGPAEVGRAYVQTTHAFFRECRGREQDCALRR